MKRRKKDNRQGMTKAEGYPVEDRALKEAARFMGEELLPLLGVEVSTYVLCTSGTKVLRSSLTEGMNTYRVKVLRNS